MSRIGKKPIPIPPEVNVELENQRVVVRGPQGILSLDIPPGFAVSRHDTSISIEPMAKETARALWGSTRALLANGVLGVTKGFQKNLEIEGIGYQARVEGENLVLRAGFTHPVIIKPLPGIAFHVERNVITVFGIDKQLVGQAAAEIRAVRKPEPYKGKGIRYQGEVIRRKAGKKAVSTA